MLAIVGAYPLAIVIASIWQRQWRRGLLAGSLVFVAGGVVGVMPVVAENVMDVPLVRALPATALVLNTRMGPGVSLVGFQPLVVGKTVARAGAVARVVLRKSLLVIELLEIPANAVSKRPGCVALNKSF